MDGLQSMGSQELDMTEWQTLLLHFQDLFNVISDMYPQHSNEARSIIIPMFILGNWGIKKLDNCLGSCSCHWKHYSKAGFNSTPIPPIAVYLGFCMKQSFLRNCPWIADTWFGLVQLQCPRRNTFFSTCCIYHTLSDKGMSSFVDFLSEPLLFFSLQVVFCLWLLAFSLDFWLAMELTVSPMTSEM